MIQTSMIPTGKSAVVTVGLPGCGKSTVARGMSHWNNPVVFKMIERDKIRHDIWRTTNPGKPFTWGTWNWDWELETTNRYSEELTRIVKTHNNVVLSDTWLRKMHRCNIIDKMQGLGYDVTILFFDIPVEVAKKRNIMRSYAVPDAVFDKMGALFYEYKEIGEKEAKDLNCKFITVPVSDKTFEYQP